MVFGGIRGYDYVQVKGLVSESKQLASAGNYKEANSKLVIAKTKWSANVRAVQDEIDNNKKLIESNKNFELGRIQYDGENYQKAIDYFNKVIPDDRNYKPTQNYIEIATLKLAEENDLEKNVTVTVTSTPRYTPTKYIEPVIPTSAPTFNPNKDEICKNTANLQKIELEEKLLDVVKKSNPELFSFEEAKKKYPGQYTSQYQDESYMRSMWASNSKIQLDGFYSGIKNESEKAYYQLYNICLQQ